MRVRAHGSRASCTTHPLLLPPALVHVAVVLWRRPRDVLPEAAKAARLGRRRVDVAQLVSRAPGWVAAQRGRRAVCVKRHSRQAAVAAASAAADAGVCGAQPAVEGLAAECLAGLLCQPLVQDPGIDVAVALQATSARAHAVGGRVLRSSVMHGPVPCKASPAQCAAPQRGCALSCQSRCPASCLTAAVSL